MKTKESVKYQIKIRWDFFVLYEVLPYALDGVKQVTLQPSFLLWIMGLIMGTRPPFQLGLITWKYFF